MRIEIISASAGSGKTTRLAQVLTEAIASRKPDLSARPEAVLATTFTNKAAFELKERVRAELLADGFTEAAERLTAGRIGTVNSVCGQLVGEFCFELGLSPEVTIVDENMASLMLSKAISAVLSDETERELAEIGSRLTELENWRHWVSEIVTKARSNGLDADGLHACAQRSWQSLATMLRKPASSPEDVEGPLRRAIDDFLAQVDQDKDKTKYTAKAIDSLRTFRRKLESPNGATWPEWVRTSYMTIGAKSKALAEPIFDCVAQYDRHPRLHRDLERGIGLVFSIAAEALEAYREHKAARGFIDFADQEALALQLLRDPDICARLHGSLDLVLVDEFQDTSPIQLAIFLALAKLAKRCVWVGDQKQSIFGFRGTDPGLMDAAIEALLGGEEPATLAKSYRSRPALVQLTCDLFAPAFLSQSIPAQRTKLKAHLDPEPDGLGEALELWRLQPERNNKPERLNVLAAGIETMLADKSVQVRDRATGDVRPLQPSDVGVLCRTNTTCASLAAALSERGIRAVLPKAGLLATVEARVALAGLRLWVDRRDSLARAELARILSHPNDPNAWLASLIEQPYARHYDDAPWLQRITEAYEQRPYLGGKAALEQVIAALELARLCASWGNTEQRLANLDALLGHAELYAQSCAARTSASTPLGLATYLEELAAQDGDHCAVQSEGGDAVTISTWHKAKGLEWPIVVLYDLDWTKDAKPFGIEMQSDSEKIDLQAPLEQRWIRFWPWFSTSKKDETQMTRRLQKCEQARVTQARFEREALRLLYVGWTRARDRLVLVLPHKNVTSGCLCHLQHDGESLVSELEDTEVSSLCGVTARVRTITPVEPQPAPSCEGYFYVARGRAEYPPAFVAPSSLHQETLELTTAELQPIGPRMQIDDASMMEHVGEALHSYFAAFDPNGEGDECMELATNILDSWGVTDCLRAESMVSAGHALADFVTRRFPESVWRREWPVSRRLDNGSIVRGHADLVLETPDDLVVIDHKSLYGPAETLAEKAKSFGAQIDAYASALEAATGKPVTHRLVHLPLAGAIVELRAPLPTGPEDRAGGVRTNSCVGSLS